MADELDTSPDSHESPAPDRPANGDLLGELAHAMHLAATSQYERLNADLERRRADQVDAIGARAAHEVEQLKADSETDVAAIDSWSKAETEKIKLERLRRIDGRRERLASELERQESIKERETVAIQGAVEAHRGEIDRFFARMERETDPAAIAQIASTMPAFPPLAEIADAARREAAAETTGLDAATGALPVAALTEAEAAEAEAAVAAAAEIDAIDDHAPVPVVIAIEADSDARISESRLMAVMGPDASRADADDARPWEAPHAVTVAAGSSAPEPVPAPEAPSRMGSTLLRTVRAIRPMSGERHDRGGGS